MRNKYVVICNINVSEFEQPVAFSRDIEANNIEDAQAQVMRLALNWAEEAVPEWTDIEVAATYGPFSGYDPEVVDRALIALSNLVVWATSGDRYQSINPYFFDEVKDGILALRAGGLGTNRWGMLYDK